MKWKLKEWKKINRMMGRKKDNKRKDVKKERKYSKNGKKES